MNRIFTSLTLICISYSLISQDCTVNLEKAQRAYFSGNLQEVHSVIAPCLERGDFDKSQLETALKLTINSLLVLDKESIATTFMKRLLQVNPLLVPKSRDLIEFQRLYESFEVKPKYNLGFIIGWNHPYFETLQFRSLGAITEESNTYDSKTGFLIGVHADRYINDFLMVSSGINYTQYGYGESELLLTYQQSFVQEQLDYLNIPLTFGLEFSIRDWDIFVNGGLGANILIRSKADIELFGIESDDQITIVSGISKKVQDFDLTYQRTRLTFNYRLGAGIRKRLGLVGLELRAGYDIGANNLVKSSKRYSKETTWEHYSYVPNDFKLNAFKASFGISRRLYKITRTGQP